MGSCLTDATPKAVPDVPSRFCRYGNPERLALPIVAALLNRVEALIDTDGAIERSKPHIGEPPLPCNLHSQRRDIDPHYLVSTALEM